MSWRRRVVPSDKAGTDARRQEEAGRSAFPPPRDPPVIGTDGRGDGPPPEAGPPPEDGQAPEAGPPPEDGQAPEAGPPPEVGRATDAAGAAVGAQVVVGAIPHEPPGFLARADLLAALDRAGPVAPGISVLTGTPGAGKTQLAGAYARARLAGGWRLVAWVNAASPESLLAGLATVAEAAGVSDGGAGQDAAGVQAVRHRLETDGDRCLIVFDNVGDAEALRPYLPAAGAARVLITSGRAPVAELGTLGVGVPVDAFTPDEALAFLASRTGMDPGSDAGGAAVAAELGYLALALAQAAAVIAARHLPYQTYLGRLRALPAEQHLARDFKDRAGAYPRRVAEAVLLSLDEIRADDLGAVTRVLEIMAVLSASGVRREILHAAGRAGVLTTGAERFPAELAERALLYLAERSLATFSLDGQTVVLHELVMQVIRDGLARRGRLTAACRAAAFALDAYAAAVVGSQDRPAVREIPEQAAALVGNAAGPAVRAGHELTELLLRVRFWALHCLNTLGGCAQQAIELGEPLVADFQRVLGFDHPDTLNARNSLAIAYQDAGRAADAVALHEQTLGAFERLEGRNHPSTLASRNNLAEAYRAVGRVREAVALHEQALAGYERIRGPDHPDTLTSRSHLAEAYRAAGRAGEAVALHEQALAGYERIRGPDHPDTLTSRSHLARAYRAAGRAGEAVALLEQVLAVRERALGPDHPATLGARSNLANAYRTAGRAADAVALLEQTVAGYERIRGHDHPATLGSRNNLANAYRTSGRVAEAIELHQQVLAVRQRVLGPGHPDTRQSQHNLARAYRDAGRAG